MRGRRRLSVTTSDEQKRSRQTGHGRTFPFAAGVAEFFCVNKLTAGGKDCRDVVGDRPVKLKLLQFTGLEVQHIRRSLESVRPAIKVVEGNFETTRRMAPWTAKYAAKRMILADDQ